MTESSEPSSTEPKLVRLHVGGLPGKINEKDIEERFRSFGKVEKVDLIAHPFEENACRGFAYVNLVTTDAQLSKCMNVLNGCAWKGGKLHISQAKPNRFQRLEDGRVIILKDKNGEEKDGGSKKRRVKKKRKLVRHAADQSLVNDKNVDKRKGWRRGRYGRAIACLKIRRPNRQILVIDPSHYKNNLEKLFGSVKPKPLSLLTWTISDIKSEEFISDDDRDEEVMISAGEEEFQDAFESSTVFEDVVMSEPTDEIVDPVETELLEVLIEPETPESEDTESMAEGSKTQDNVESESEVLVSMASESKTFEPVIKMELESGILAPIETESNTQQDNLGSGTNTQDKSASPKPENSTPKPVEPKFEVNTTWSSLFAPQPSTSAPESSSGFSFNSMFANSSKIKNVSVEELFKKDIEPMNTVNYVAVEFVAVSVVDNTVPLAKKVHNYAHLFGDLNRITPTTATRFGMLLSQKEEMLQEWRVERIELKEDFKKKLSEGKRRNRRDKSRNRN